jgi:hypothetical protein
MSSIYGRLLSFRSKPMKRMRDCAVRGNLKQVLEASAVSPFQRCSTYKGHTVLRKTNGCPYFAGCPYFTGLNSQILLRSFSRPGESDVSLFQTELSSFQRVLKHLGPQVLEEKGVGVGEGLGEGERKDTNE